MVGTGKTNRQSEKSNYDKVDSLNGFIKFVLERRDKMKVQTSLKEIVEEATRVAQASGIKLEDYYTNTGFNKEHLIIQK